MLKVNWANYCTVYHVHTKLEPQSRVQILIMNHLCPFTGAKNNPRHLQATTYLHAHARAHSLFFFIADMQPRALQCPGVFRPLKVLTGKESVHQRVVVSKQAAAPSPGVRGCMFDVTSRVEVASLLRPHTHTASISTCKSLRKECNFESQRVLVATVNVQEKQTARMAHFGTSSPIFTTLHSLFLSL